jgi:3-oxoacyl-[acyl-carrier-protein] synthase III
MSSEPAVLVRPVVTRAAWIAGERVFSAAELAELQGTTVPAVERSLGGRLACVSARSGVELGFEAAKQCIDQADCPPKAIGSIIWFGDQAGARPAMHLQHRLGAVNANPIALAFNCTELVTALELTRAMMREDERLDRVLIVGGATWGAMLPHRSRLQLKENAYDTIFSDAGSALLVQRSGPGAEIVSFGNGSVGALWEYLRRQAEPPAAPDDPRGPLLSVLQALLYSRPAHDRALKECLERGATTAAELDHVLFAREPGGVERALMKQMGLDVEKLWDLPGGPTHTGVADQIVGLEQLMNGNAKPGARIVVAARTIGLMRCALLRMRDEKA